MLKIPERGDTSNYCARQLGFGSQWVGYNTQRDTNGLKSQKEKMDKPRWSLIPHLWDNLTSNAGIDWVFTRSKSTVRKSYSRKDPLELRVSSCSHKAKKVYYLTLYTSYPIPTRWNSRHCWRLCVPITIQFRTPS